MTIGRGEADDTAAYIERLEAEVKRLEADREFWHHNYDRLNIEAGEYANAITQVARNAEQRGDTYRARALALLKQTEHFRRIARIYAAGDDAIDVAASALAREKQRVADLERLLERASEQLPQDFQEPFLGRMMSVTNPLVVEIRDVLARKETR